MEPAVNEATLPDEAELGRRIARMIQATQHGASAASVGALQPLSGGNARRAWAFQARWSDAEGSHSQECVLLARAESGQVEGDTGREYATLQALAATAVPAPRPLWLDAQGSWLGMPGFVAQRARGRASAAELLVPTNPASRPLVLELVRLAARLHAVAWESLPHAFPDPEPDEDPTAAMLDFWQGQFLRHRMEPVPALGSVLHWLRRNMPRQARRCIVHGDFRVGNFLHEEGRITLLLDWELSHLGDPVEDLAWMYRPLWSPEAFVDVEETLAVYEAAGGGRIERRHLLWWRIFSEMKFAVISLTAARNFRDGTTDNLRLAGRASSVASSLLKAMKWINQLEATP